MSKADKNVGFDYGQGTTNMDPMNGIRFGVISQHSISQAWGDCAEPDYGTPHCPKCGQQIPFDLHCERCDADWDDHECTPEEPVAWRYQKDGFELSDCLDSDVFVTKSPYYTYAQFCSPCVPGAGNLDNPMDRESGAPRTYCLDKSWFEDAKAPYRYWRVKDNTEVLDDDHQKT